MSRPLTLFAPILVVLAAAPLIEWSLDPSPPSVLAAFAESDAGMTLRRVQLSAPNLAAVGATGADVTAIVEDMETWVGDNTGEIAAADAALASATQAWAACRAKIQSGQASQAECDGLAALETAKNNAQSTLSTLLDGAFDAAVDSLSSSEQDLAANLRANSSWRLAPYFLVTNRSESSWVDLRNALDEQRIAAKYEEDASSAALAIISAALGDADIAAAKVDYEANLTAVETAWDNAVEE